MGLFLEPTGSRFEAQVQAEGLTVAGWGPLFARVPVPAGVGLLDGLFFFFFVGMLRKQQSGTRLGKTASEMEHTRATGTSESQNLSKG